MGEYVIKLSGGDAINYDFTFIPGTLTITKAPLSITVKDTNRVYGSSNPQFELEYYGLKNGETNPLWITAPTIHTVADINSNVGQYQIKATGGILKNYELGSIDDGILNITPAQLTIRANDAVRQYYNENPAFSYKCVGFVNGENENEFLEQPILATNALLSSNVGTYEIKVSGAKSVNYNISYVCGTLNVIPRTLTAIVGNYERAYGEENPEFIVVYDGFVNEEDEEALLTKAVANTVANKTSDVGTYLIKVSGGSAENYELTYSSGLLTINKAEQTIDWIQQLDSLTIGDQVELNAKASSGLIITYTIDPTNCAEIYNAGTKTYLDCIANGEFFIVAVQEGNKNYYSSPRARKKVVIGKTRKQYDVNNDDIIDISDIVATINVIAAGQTDDKSDVNNDGKTDISDIVAIINAIANQ